jgi:phospholipid transport system substrate-binding protein
MSVSRRVLLYVAAGGALFGRPPRGGAAQAVGAPPAADSPTATVQAFYEALLAVMKAAKQMTFDERYDRLQQAITRAFNLSLITRVAIGPAWTGLPPAQQERLTASFARWTIATYASRFDGYAGERFEVDPKPAPNPNGVVVATRLVRPSGEPVELNYLMRRNATGRWQVIDVFLSGTVSELATRRSEFVGVLRRDGADGLVRLLDQRAATLRAG